MGFACADSTASSFAKSTHNLIVQGLDEMRYNLAFSSLDERLDRHSRDQPDVAETGNLIFLGGDPNGVVARAALPISLLRRYVRRDPADGASDFRCGSLAES